MSVAALKAVIPDKVSPESGWRIWKFEYGHLTSLNHQGVWTPREAMKASCQAHRMPWLSWMPGPPVQVGAVRETVEKFFHSYHQNQQYVPPGQTPPPPVTYGEMRARVMPPRPRTLLPDGREWNLCFEHPEPHVAPDEHCTCGIYAALTAQTCPVDYQSRYTTHLAVFGPVQLWGKVVPGDAGWRAEFAYPAELFIVRPQKDQSGAPKIKDAENALKEFGVPVWLVENRAELHELVAAAA